MFVVLFEVNPRRERWDEYLGYAKRLRPELEKIDGFIENERFASKSRDGWLVSVSTWRDEKALIRWRTLGLHHMVQEKGREQVFRDYHLRVGEMVGDTAPPPGQMLREQRTDETETGEAKFAVLTGVPDLSSAEPATGALEQDLFESITQPGKGLRLSFWPGRSAAEAWMARAAGPRHRVARIIRDYGMFDRREAPQFYPSVSREPAE
jgi:heme-degrading monooxygenase HmoA